MMYAIVLLVTLLLPSFSDAAVTFYWGMENTSPDDLTLSGTTDYTAGADTACTVNGTADVNATAALKGSAGLQVLTTGDRCSFNSEAAIHNVTEGTIGVYFRVQTWVNSASLFVIRGTTSANDHVKCILSSADDITCNVRHSVSGNTVLSTAALGLTTNTTYFLTFQYHATNNDMRICVYDSGGSLVAACTEDLSTEVYAPSDLAVSGGMRIGDSEGFAAAFYIDNFFYGNAYDDQTCIYNNRDITSYANYSCGGATVNFFPRRLQVQP